MHPTSVGRSARLRVASTPPLLGDRGEERGPRSAKLHECHLTRKRYKPLWKTAPNAHPRRKTRRLSRSQCPPARIQRRPNGYPVPSGRVLSHNVDKGGAGGFHPSAGEAGDYIESPGPG